MAASRSRHCPRKGPRGGFVLASVLWLAACGESGEKDPEIQTVSLQQGIEHGRLIASGGEPAGTEYACFSCHGVAGQGDAGSGVPQLAGLSAYYIAKQLNDYDSGRRPSEIMSPIARELAQFDRQAVGVYYQQLASIAPEERVTLAHEPDLVQRGAILYAVGAQELRLQGCVNCHGPAARGLPPFYPALAGQPASYIAEQLRLWKTGVRDNDISDVMTQVARRMSSRDIEATAAYLSELEP